MVSNPDRALAKITKKKFKQAFSKFRFLINRADFYSGYKKHYQVLEFEIKYQP